MIEPDKEQQLQQFIDYALAEDIGEGDHTTLATIPADGKGKAVLIIKEAGILAGLEIALCVFRTVDKHLEIKILRRDGDPVQIGDHVLEVSGNIHGILKAERLVLNIMQRMSGIATVTHRVTNQLRDTGTEVLDTRKTTPGMRLLEKEAVKIGGGVNHRFGLYDMILIKDNHVDFCGGIFPALDAANQYRSKLQKAIQIEIEVRNLKELQAVIDHGGADRILLDNFEPQALKEAVALVNGRFVTEASGGITEYNAREYALSGVNYISMGALTHSVKSLDMSLKAQITR